MCRHKLKIILCLRARLSSLRSWKGCNRDNLGQIYGSGCWVNAHDFNKTAPCLPIPAHQSVISGTESANTQVSNEYFGSIRSILCLFGRIQWISIDRGEGVVQGIKGILLPRMSLQPFPRFTRHRSLGNGDKESQDKRTVFHLLTDQKPNHSQIFLDALASLRSHWTREWYF